MASSSLEQSASLELTPTWIVAIVCSLIVAISMSVERFLHYIGKYLNRKKQYALFNSLEKLKEELMLLGFISLLLTVFQGLISNTCIPANAASRNMLPCNRMEGSVSHYYTFTQNRRRLLAIKGDSGHCVAQNKVPLLSVETLHQLHIFIFVLAVVHVIFCASTLILGFFKIEKKWKVWEISIPTKEQSHVDIDASEQFDSHILHHKEFIRKRVMGSFRSSTVGSWIMAFFKQFHASVTKSDYLCLRYGFIRKHSQTNMNFDFHKFMLRTVQRDFKQIVGITWYLWLFVILFLLLDVDGWHIYFYLSFLPLVLLLLVGAKLEHIITSLGLAAMAHFDGRNMRHMPRIKPSDKHFWFHRPRIVLHILHFILFQNAFEFAFFFWILSAYGFDSCIMGSLYYVIPRLVIGLMVQVLCSYSTLPLYAIVSQMGDEFKQSMFDEEVHSQLHALLQNAKRNVSSQKGKAGLSSPEIQMYRMEHEVLHSDKHPTTSFEENHKIHI